MIKCSKMLESQYLYARKRRTPYDLSAIRSWIVTELAADLSIFEVRMLLLYVSIYRTHSVSKKNGYCRLAPPIRQQYSQWCQVLNDLVAKSNEPKKPAFPLLARMHSLRRADSITHSVSHDSGCSSSSTVPSNASRSFILAKQSSFPLPSIRNNVGGEGTAGEEKLQQLMAENEKQKEERLLAFRAQNSSVVREQSRRNMLGTLDYTPHKTTFLSSSPSSTSPVSRNKNTTHPIIHASSLNDMTDTAIFGGVSSMDSLLRPDENGDPVHRPTTAIAIEKIRFRRESKFVKNEVFRVLGI